MMIKFKLFFLLLMFDLLKASQSLCEEVSIKTSSLPSKACCNLNANSRVLTRNNQIEINDLRYIKHNCLQIKNETIFYMPEFKMANYQNLQFLVVSYSKLKQITSEDLKNFEGLRYLNLKGNELRILKDRPFQHNPNLEEINLSNNKIKIIVYNTFDGLTMLTVLNLTNNICIKKSANNKNEIIKALTSSSTCGISDQLSSLVSILGEEVWESKVDMMKDLLTQNFSENPEIQQNSSAEIINTCDNVTEELEQYKIIANNKIENCEKLTHLNIEVLNKMSLKLSELEKSHTSHITRTVILTTLITILLMTVVILIVYKFNFKELLCILKDSKTKIFSKDEEFTKTGNAESLDEISTEPIYAYATFSQAERTNEVEYVEIEELPYDSNIPKSSNNCEDFYSQGTDNGENKDDDKDLYGESNLYAKT